MPYASIKYSIGTWTYFKSQNCKIVFVSVYDIFAFVYKNNSVAQMEEGWSCEGGILSSSPTPS